MEANVAMQPLQAGAFGLPLVTWRAVLAGWIVGGATQIMLSLLGLGIGAWTMDLHEPDPASGIQIGTVIWTGLSLLISAFVGSYLAAALSRACLRSEGMMQGIVSWGVSWVSFTIFSVFATTAMLGLLGGMFNVFATALHSMGKAAAPVISHAVSTGTTNVSTDQLRRQIEAVRKTPGKAPLSDSGLTELKQQLDMADRDGAVKLLVGRVGLSKAQAQTIVQQNMGVVGRVKERAGPLKNQTLDAGNTALDRLGTASIWMFVFGLLTLGMAIIGGSMGVQRAVIRTPEAGAYRSAV
jgi:hypothetical protein